MTVVAWLKLFHKHNDHCSGYSNLCASIHSPYFDDIRHVLWSIRSMATRVFALELWWICSLICVKIATEVVAQSCRTVYDTIILIIHGANLNRASTSSLSCCGLALRCLFFRQVRPIVEVRVPCLQDTNMEIGLLNNNIIFA